MLRKKLYKDKKTGCWEYTGNLTQGGYGPHRFYYELYTGKKIPLKMTIDHLCNNRKCCNPQHLEVVPMAENKRRSSKLNYTLVYEIKKRYKEGKRQIDLAKQFNVNQSTISRIINNIQWYEL